MDKRRTAERRKAQGEIMRRWWQSASPESRLRRVEKIKIAAQTESHRENMSRNRWKYGRLGNEDKKTPKAIRSPSIPEIYWASGFIEGDGCFQKNGVSGSVVVAQVNKEPLDLLLSIFGGRISKIYRKQYGPNHNDAFEWRVTGPRARGVMFTIFSMLSDKRRRQSKLAFGISMN